MATYHDHQRELIRVEQRFRRDRHQCKEACGAAESGEIPSDLLLKDSALLLCPKAPLAL